MPLEGLIRAVDVNWPSWLENKCFHYLLPSRSPISYAALRAKIYLVSADLIDRLCPPEKRCLPDDLADRAREALRDLSRRVEEKLRQTPREKLDPWKLADEISRDINATADQVFKSTGKAGCTEIETLAFYAPDASRILNHMPELKGAVEPGPVIFISIEKIENVVDQELGDAIKALHPWDFDYEKKRAKEQLFRYALAHEVTHSYADLAPEHSPKRRYEDEYENKRENKLIARVIEESLATYYGLKSIHNEIITNWILTRHPPEYRAAKTWREHPEHIAASILDAWIGLTSTRVHLTCPLLGELCFLIRELLYYSRRYPLRAIEVYAPLASPLMNMALAVCYATSRDSDAYWKLLALQLLAQTPPRIT